jgi:hypothetical protein
MHRLNAFGLGLVLLAATVLVWSPPAQAGSKSAKAECDDTGCASSVRSVEEIPGRRRSGPRRRAPSACTFRVVDVADGTPIYRPDGSVIEVDGTGRWYEKRCRVEVPPSSAPFGTSPGVGEVGRRAETTELVYLRRRPAAPPQELAMEAMGELPLPEPAIATSPPPQFDSVVNVPVFLAVDSADWQPKSVTTGVTGVTVTVVAVPTRTEWQLGNGDVVVCDGPGTPYDFSRPEHDQVADCVYTYRTTSIGQPDERFPVTATVVWRASWSAVGAPGGGDLGEVRRSATTSLRVVQVQTVNVYEGSG